MDTFRNTSTREKIFLVALVAAFAAIFANWRKIFNSIDRYFHSL